MAKNPCGGCGLNPPTIPFQYPYTRPARDSYGFCPCPPTPGPDKHPGPKPNPNRFPTCGNFVGSGFALVDAFPYLIDTTTLQYGQLLSYSENVVTKVTRRNDASCINLAATFDMTNTNLNNVVLFDFLKKVISKKYAELEGVLPIIKETIRFKIYYTITDYQDGVVHNGIINKYTNNEHFHFTDVKDMYVTSTHDIVMENIPAMTYAGLYTLTIDKVEAYVAVLNTKEHCQGPLNPFYQFTDNNMKIHLQHDLINATELDDEILIAETPVNVSIDYKANVTNRLKLSFTAFMSTLIAAPDTAEIWDVLTEPTEEVVTQMRQELTEAEEAIVALQNRDAQQQAEIDALRGQVELNKNNITQLLNRVTGIENNVAMYKTLIDDLTDRVLALENRPLALVSYREGKIFVTPQLTWNGYGNLYQCARNFTANGDFDVDVANGNLVPVVSDEGGLEPIIERIATVEGTVSDLSTEVTTIGGDVDALDETVTGLSTLPETVSGLSESVTTMGGTIETVQGDITSLTGRISELEDDVDDLKNKELEKNKVVIQNLTTGAKQYVNSYGAAATILKEDLEGSYKVYPGEGYTQQTISAETFKNVTSLKEIVLADSVTSLGNYAFNGSGLTKLDIGQNVTSCGYYLCDSCADLEQVTVDAPNLELGSQSFSYCPKLTHPNFVAVKKIGAACCIGSGIVSTTIPIGCTEIGAGAFSNTSSMESITIEATSITAGAFNGSAVKTVNMNYAVTTVANGAFSGCDGVTFNISKPQDAISGSPWGATNATVNWNA